MTTYTINIGGKVCVAEGTHIDDINPNNGHPYEVVTVKDLRIGGEGENVLRYLIDKDKILRKAEREEVRKEYDGKWEMDLAAWKDRHPDASDDDIAAYRAHWETLRENRRIVRRRTNGLHATIDIPGLGSRNAYLMPDRSGVQEATFRTFIPKDVREESVAGVPENPF